MTDCAASPNNRGPRWPELSAIDVTEKAFFERLYSILGLAPIGAPDQLSLYSHTPTAHSTAISQFPCNFFSHVAPLFFCWHDSPSNLAESRYPLPYLEISSPYSKHHEEDLYEKSEVNISLRLDH